MCILVAQLNPIIIVRIYFRP